METVETFRALLPRGIANLPRPVRLRAENALRGFDKARVLFPIDREMASFRAITAEEEAAAALFKSFQIRRYPGADVLSTKDHYAKAALGPFIQAVKHSLAPNGEFTMEVTLDWSKPSIEVSLPISQFGGPQEYMIVLSEPLGMVGHRENQPAANFYDRSLAVVAGSRQLHKMIASEANARNRLLYASDSTLPESKATLASIDARQQRAEIALFLCIAVLQIEGHQAMGTQGIAAFSKLVGRKTKKPECTTD